LLLECCRLSGLWFSDHLLLLLLLCWLRLQMQLPAAAFATSIVSMINTTQSLTAHFVFGCAQHVGCIEHCFIFPQPWWARIAR
jgi:hypothetical protein